MAQIAADALGCDARAHPGDPGRHRDLPVRTRQLQLARHHVSAARPSSSPRPSCGTSCSTSPASMLEAAAADLDAADGRSSSRARPSRVGRLRRRSSTRSTGTPSASTPRASSPGSRRPATSGSATSTTSPRSRAGSAPIRPGRTASPPRSSRSTPRPASSRSSATALVDDAGTIINPLLVDANLHGAIAQGIGGAMYEQHRVRRGRPAPDRDAHGLHDPDRGRGAQLRDRAPGDAVAVHAARA